LDVIEKQIIPGQLDPLDNFAIWCFFF